jgi:hypothetical protein
MQVTVKVDLKGVNKMLDGLAKDQIPFAAAYALTQTVKAAQHEVEKEIPRVFDRPTPYTLKAVAITSATKTRLSAQVRFKDQASSQLPQVKYLYPETEGGPRNVKAFELSMQLSNGRLSGGVMPHGWYAVPTSYAPLDKYGNVSRGTILKILSQLQATLDPMVRERAATKKRRDSMRSRVRKRGGRYFVAMPGAVRTAHLKPGIYERITTGFGSAIKPIFLYVQRAPRYRKRLDFYRIVNDTINAQIAFQFKRGFLQARRTAK